MAKENPAFSQPRKQVPFRIRGYNFLVTRKVVTAGYNPPSLRRTRGFWMRISALHILPMLVFCGVVCCWTSAQEPAMNSSAPGQAPGSLQAAGTQDSDLMVHDPVPVAIVHSEDDPVAFTVHVDGRALGWTPATDTEPRHTEVVLQVTTFDKKNKQLN